VFRRNRGGVQRNNGCGLRAEHEGREATAGKVALRRLGQVWLFVRGVNENGRLVMEVVAMVEEYRFLRPDHNKHSRPKPKAKFRLTASGSMRQQQRDSTNSLST
jgi:hypothetical protein